MLAGLYGRPEKSFLKPHTEVDPEFSLSCLIPRQQPTTAPWHSKNLSKIPEDTLTVGAGNTSGRPESHGRQVRFRLLGFQ